MKTYFYPIAILGLMSILSKGQGASFSELVVNVEYSQSISSILDNNANYPDNGHYLIITPPDWEPYLEPLANWKLRKGHPVTIVTTEVTGATANEIQVYLQSAMDTWVNPPVYLLLIGDVDVGVPSHYVAEPGQTSNQYVTEHPYSLLVGDDMFPDLFVGRLTVDTLSELLVVINKILVYEKTPYMDGPNWLNKALMLCTIADVASPQPTVNWVRRKMLNFGYTQVDTSYDPMQNDMESATDPINAGVGFVNYRGSGSPNGFWLAGRFFMISDVESLSNGNMLPIVTVMTCGSGSYGGGGEMIDPSIGEAWLRAGTVANPKGAVAYIGPSSTNTHTEYNNIMNIGFYSALFDQGLYTLGEALWAAKLEMWNNYGDGFDSPWGHSAPYYQHLYNLQGDPGMEVRKKMPEMILVSHPDSISSITDHITLHVTNSLGEPVYGYVCVYDQNAPIGQPTAGESTVIVPLNELTSDSLQITVTGPDLYPYLYTIPVFSSEESLSITEWSINDDFLAAGDSISISLTVFNPGSSIGSTNFTLTPEYSDLFSFDNLDFAIDSISGNGSTTIERSLDGKVLESAAHGSVGDLTLTLHGSSGSTNSFKPLTVQASYVELLPSQISSDSISPGDTISYSLNLRNSGGVSTGPVWVKPISNEWLTFLTDTSTVDQIEVDETLAFQGPVIAQVASQYYDGQVVKVFYEIGHSNLLDTIASDLPLGGIEPYAPSAPDGYGYYVFDLNDQSFSKAPTFDWVEIDTSLDGLGIPIELQDSRWDRDASTQISLPFEVKYYGETYNTATVCSNGWMAFGSSPEISFHNRTIPSPSGPVAMVAPYWDNLMFDGTSVYEYYDESNSRLIIEWSSVVNLYNDEPFSFQIIIYNTDAYPTPTGDADILFQYLEFEESALRTNFFTIGIESPDYLTGSLVSYNNEWFSNVSALDDMSAVLFTTDRGLRIAPTSIKGIGPEQPMKHSLLPPYPNPGNASFTIPFVLEDMSSAQIKIFNLLGQEINELEIGLPEPGSHKVMWNGQDYSGRNVSSGIYLIQLGTSSGIESRKVVVLK